MHARRLAVELGRGGASVRACRALGNVYGSSVHSGETLRPHGFVVQHILHVCDVRSLQVQRGSLA